MNTIANDQEIEDVEDVEDVEDIEDVDDDVDDIDDMPPYGEVIDVDTGEEEILAILPTQQSNTGGTGL